MAFDFPNSPSEGTTFAPSGGPVYVYTGGVWRMQGSGQVVTAEARNRLVNPAFQISQENGNTLSPASGYIADQWVLGHQNDGTITWQRVQSTTPNGSKDRFRIAVTVAQSLLTSTLTYPGTKLEGIRTADLQWGTAKARPIVVRFGWKSPAGTYAFAMKNSALNRNYIVPFTISAAQANTDTEQVFAIPGDTTGAWPTDTSASLYPVWIPACGADFIGASVPNTWQAGNIYGVPGLTNGVGTVGNTFEIFDMGLYADPNATGVPPPWQMPDEAEELRACERYYEKGRTTMQSSYVTASSLFFTAAIFRTVKRVAPTVGLVTVGSAGFVTTSGAASNITVDQAQESRTANATVASGYFWSSYTANARM